MNEDFALEFTPANARRLIEIARIFPIDLDDRVAPLAKMDLISLDTDAPDILAPPSDGARAATQFIIDCGLRCVIPRLEQDISRHLILNAIRLSGFEGMITVATPQKTLWKDTIRRSFSFEDRVTIGTVKAIFEPESPNSPEAIERRMGVLVLDWSEDLTESNRCLVTAISRDYLRTIIYADPEVGKIASTGFKRPVAAWWSLAEALFPEMPRVHSVGNERDDLAILYNTFLPNKLRNYGGYD